MNSAVKHKADEALNEAYRQYYLPLLRYCTVRLGEAKEAAGDCVQDAFVVFYNRLLSGEDVQNPRAFLYRTADNFRRRALQSYQTAQSKTVPLENAEPYSIPFLPFSPEDMDYDRLAKALLDTLSDDEQTLYRWKYSENVSLSEIAERLGISPAAAAKRTSRLRQRICEKLSQTIETETKGGI